MITPDFVFSDWKVPVKRMREERPKTDPLGQKVIGTGSLVSEDLPPALFAHSSSSESNDPGEDSVSSKAMLYFPGEFPDVSPSDSLEVMGKRWVVVGEPAVWPMGLVVNLAVETKERP